MPIEWATRYNDHNHVFPGPIVSHLQSAQARDEAYAASSQAADVKLIDGEASDFGLRVSHAVPAPILDGSLATITRTSRTSSRGTARWPNLQSSRRERR